MSARGARAVSNLPEQIADLALRERELFESLFAVVRTEGSLVPPSEMTPWIERVFGSTEPVEHQTIVKTLNRWTLEGALFNDLRARRPMQSRADPELYASLAGDGTDPFCSPLTGTPADAFGRVEGRHSLTASNVAKYDGLHGVVVFDHHHPLEWDRDRVSDAFHTALEWLRAAHEERPCAAYPFVMWNCLPRSGASIVHAHVQVALTEGAPYGRVELWRRAAEAYRRERGGDYFDSLWSAHRAVGLTGDAEGVGWLAHITPIKEKEVVLLAEAADNALFGAIYSILRGLVDGLGVRAFNLAMYLPPLGPTPEDWSGFPAIARIVDRGDPSSATSDIGAMELFAQPVVVSDPWRLAETLRAEATTPD